MDVSDPHSTTASPEPPVSENYQYWRDNGATWISEYDRRKKTIPSYHIQEIMLASYLEQCAPVRVLEFGCGIGRHLRYLNEIAGLEIHGYDQSETMVGGLETWADAHWIGERVRLGSPTGTLPYPDKYFDVTYTAEVLVHVRPEDLPSVLQELMRVTKWHVLHLEPAPGVAVERDCHNGCWNHDLPRAYAELGIVCETLESAYPMHAPYRAVLAPGQSLPVWSAVQLKLMKRMERDLSEGLSSFTSEQMAYQKALDAKESQMDSLRRQAAEQAVSMDELKKSLHEAQAERDTAARQRDAAAVQLEEASAQCEQLNERIQNLTKKIIQHEMQNREQEARIRHVTRQLTETQENLQNEQATTESLRNQVQDLKTHYHLLENHECVRIARRLSRMRLYDLWSRRIKRRQCVSIQALGAKSEQSQGKEVWLLSGYTAEEAAPIPLDLLSQVKGSWARNPDASAPFGHILFSQDGLLSYTFNEGDPVFGFLRHPWSGKIRIECNAHAETFDLYSPNEGQWIKIWPTHKPMKTLVSDAPQTAQSIAPAQMAKVELDESEQRWIEELSARSSKTIALHVPRWLGVTSSTTCLFDSCYAYPYSPGIEPSQVLPQDIKRQARILLESGMEHVIFSGGDMFHLEIARQLKKENPAIRCDLLWHASFLQFSEDESWRLIVQWMNAAKEGVVHTIGVVKKGMETFFESQGIRSRLIYNYVPEVPSGPSNPLPDGPHLGLWISGFSYRKLPYAALAGAAMIPNAVIHSANLSERGMAVVDQFDLRKGHTSSRPLPHDELMKRMAETHLTLYVTFSECCPMLPLESLSVGVPCLIGPASHLFEDDDYLFSRLVVPFPDRADVIAQYARRALDERDEIVRRYMEYAPTYNQRARESVDEFLGD